MPTYPTDLNTGAEVYSSDGHKLGELSRFVLRRGDFSITHIVVKLDKGVFPTAYEDDRVLPVDTMASVTTDRIDLNLTAEAVEAAPEYSDEYFEAPQDVSPGEFDIPDVVNRLGQAAAMMNSVSGAWQVQRMNRPLDSLDIREGLGVWRGEPHTKVGEVERGLFDAQTGQLQALVLKRGFILHHDVILPVRYITEVIDDVSVRVDISDEEIAQLRRYEG
jgi:uncharacterized protein YrrD